MFPSPSALNFPRRFVLFSFLCIPIWELLDTYLFFLELGIIAWFNIKITLWRCLLFRFEAKPQTDTIKTFCLQYPPVGSSSMSIDQSSKKCAEDLQVGPSQVCARVKVLGTRVCYLTWLLSLNPRTEGEWWELVLPSEGEGRHLLLLSQVNLKYHLSSLASKP